MNYLVRFWVVVLSLITGISALGFLTMSFIFPEATLFSAAGPEGRLLVTLIGVVAIGIVVWSSSNFGDVVTENPPGRERS
jgi:hypothetical protein